LAIVFVPREHAGAGQQPATNDPAEPARPVEPAEPWVFPFDMPLPPAEGDNQAAAYNTTDGSMIYDVAFALVWASGDEVLNVNEAHAYASCSNCVTVAVAFQVVLIMDDAHLVVPQNLAVAANYQCHHCITAALARQLVLSVDETPGQEHLLALAEVWNRLTEFGASITAFSLSEISTQLEAFQDEIIAILGNAPPAQPASTSTPSQNGAPPTAGTSEPTPASSPSSSPTSPPRLSEPSPGEPSVTQPSPSEQTPSEQTPSGESSSEQSPSQPTTETSSEPTTAMTPGPQSPEPTTGTTTSPPSPSP
jgi:putative peptide zinc metalloprotease protein